MSLRLWPLACVLSTPAFADPPAAPIDHPEVLAAFQADPPVRIAERWRGRGGFDIYDRGGELDRSDVYHLLGRDDLRAAYERRERIAGYTAAGAVAAIGGALLLRLGHTPDYDLAAVSAASAGGVAALVACYYATHLDPISGDELRGMIDDYDDRAARAEYRRWRLSAGGLARSF